MPHLAFNNICFCLMRSAYLCNYAFQNEISDVDNAGAMQNTISSSANE